MFLRSFVFVLCLILFLQMHLFSHTAFSKSTLATSAHACANKRTCNLLVPVHLRIHLGHEALFLCTQLSRHPLITY